VIRAYSSVTMTGGLGYGASGVTEGRLADRLSLSERAQAWFGYIPGAVLVSIVAPQVLNAGPSGLIAALAVVLVARRRAFSMLTGVLVILAVRTLESGIF